MPGAQSESEKLDELLRVVEANATQDDLEELKLQLSALERRAEGIGKQLAVVIDLLLLATGIFAFIVLNARLEGLLGEAVPGLIMSVLRAALFLSVVLGLMLISKQVHPK